MIWTTFSTSCARLRLASPPPWVALWLAWLLGQFPRPCWAKATPDQLLALKQAEQDFAVKMRELDIDLERIANEDRDSARNREVTTKDWTPRILAGLITVGYFGALFYMLRNGLPQHGGSEAMLVMLGTLGTAWGGVVAYYFGSSAGSKEKTEAMNRMVSR